MNSRAHFVLLCLAVVAVAFAAGLAWGQSAGSASGRSTTKAGATASATVPVGAPDLPASLYTDCVPQPVPIGTGASCSTALPGVDQVLVVTWPTAGLMQADFAKTQGRKPDGKCGSYRGTPASGLRSTWGGGNPLACYVNSEGSAVVLWEVPERALELLAVRKDGDTRAAFAWWQQAVKTPL